MAGNLTGLHVFGGDVSPEPLALLDGVNTALANVLNNLITFSNYYLDTGALNALAITTTGAQLVAYTDGLLLQVKVANTTTSPAPTIAVNALGTKTITDNVGAALFPGAMVANGRYLLIFDGANFRLLNPSNSVQYGVVVKGNSTSRASTSVLSNDPDLVLALPSGGLYEIELLMLPNNGGVASAGSMAYNLNYSGTFISGNSSVADVAKQNSSGGGGALNWSAIQATQTVAGSSFTGFSGVVAQGQAIGILKATLDATAAGTLGFAWAQSVSNANPIIMGVNSYMKARLL